ncbi:MAG: aminopeptidase [Lachnospiraceae bacterium]|nr:aminopeptidase [Lachnospiraceae bacterium]MBO7363335.1 aminopeptidase [Lachnospiraceae bacterium]MBO7531820.1 aminopeptidase [Lachnospiraceae bacterium]MBP5762283.1 aminopeptidase [Lachnospiraceae bacterium]
MEYEKIWKKYSQTELKKLEKLNAEYIDFLSEGKTERECVDRIVNLAEANGYVELDKLIGSGKKLKTGDKVYTVWMNKSVCMFRIGKKPFSDGMNILGAHIDSPRMDVKSNPLYEKDDFALLDTHYYGGIKKYQYTALPLAIHGVVVKKDGSTVEINIGEDPDDPVFFVSDLLIHLAQDQMEKKGSKVVEGEDLDVIVGNKPIALGADVRKNAKVKEDKKDSVKNAILKILKEQYDFEEKDFYSAELEVVPAGRAREAGFDRSMILSYGQDDRVCAFTSLKAMLDLPQCDRTICTILVDKEEIGSVGATGMRSKFFENAVAEVMNLCGEYNSEIDLKRALSRSCMLSSDVSAGVDPNYESVFEKKNAAFLGGGIVFNKFTGSRGKSGSNDANAEYIAAIRRVFEDAGISYQFAELGKVDQGGGGTIAYILALYGMNVIDSGVAVLNMHSPWEATSKADVYETYKGYIAFCKGMDL